jgi:ABC-type transport system involved in multi-copper enzyme maturation permease subunit
MLGPVLRQELRAGSRRPWLPVFRCIGGAWLAWQLVPFLEPTRVPYPLGPGAYSLLYPIPATMMLCGLIVQQLALVVLLTPALAAGALTDEKARGTLQLLLTTGLTPAAIVRDKWLGRAFQAGAPALLGLPLLAYLAADAELGPGTTLGLAFLWVGPLLALTAAGVLASTLCRTTTEALLLLYGGGLALLVAVRWLGGPLSQFDPTHALGVLEPARWRFVMDTSFFLDGPSAPPLASSVPLIEELNSRLLGAAVAWGSLTVICLGLATWRLRPAYRRQLEGGARGGRGLTARPRPPVADDPLRWKECFVEGLAPLGVCRGLPPWAGVVLVFTLSLIALGGVALWCYDPDGLSGTSAVSAGPGRALTRGLAADPLLERIEQAFLFQCLVVGAFTALVVGVRCSSAVNGERARGTWEPLLLTDLDVRSILHGKVQGVRAAVLPYGLAYAAPAVLVALVFGTPAAVLWVVCALAFGWALIHFMAAFGVHASAATRTAWASLLATVLGGVCVAGGACVLAGLVTVALGCLLALVFLSLGTFQALAFLDPLVGGYLLWGRCLLTMFFAVATFVLHRTAADMLDSAERGLAKADPDGRR